MVRPRPERERAFEPFLDNPGSVLICLICVFVFFVIYGLEAHGLNIEPAVDASFSGDFLSINVVNFRTDANFSDKGRIRSILPATHLNEFNLIEHCLVSLYRERLILTCAEVYRKLHINFLAIGIWADAITERRISPESRSVPIRENTIEFGNLPFRAADVCYGVVNFCWFSADLKTSELQFRSANYNLWPELQSDVPAGNLNAIFRSSNILSEQPSLGSYISQRAYAYRNSAQTCEEQENVRQIVRSKQFREITFRVIFGGAALIAGMLLLYHNDLRGGRGRFLDGLYLLLIASGLGAFLFPIYWQDECDNSQQQHDFHSGDIVPQKYLTSNSYWGTVIDMANVLNTDKQIAVIGALAEGSSIRSIERITGVHRDTIMRLGVKVGEGCAKMLDTAMRDLPCNRLEMDEVWGFVGKKDRNVREGEDGVGSVWTFCAIDAETKLVPAFKCGNRDAATAKAFVQDVADRMAYRVQISTDGLTAYVPAMEAAFGGNVDYAQIIKTYGQEEVSNNRRYSAPEFVSSEKKVIVGNPDERLISTSYVERLNATTRLHMRRLTRLTLAFSKKRENFEAAVALHFAYYNFVKRHGTLRCTPAMAAGVTGTFWGVGDLLEAAA